MSTTTTTPYGAIITETEDYISFRLPSWLTVEERARIKLGLDEWWGSQRRQRLRGAPGRARAAMTAVTHRAWCNSHVDDGEDGPGLCSRESEPVDTFGIDITEDDNGLAVDLWNPMRPGQGRSFTAAELRAIAAELVWAAELIEAEEGIPKA